MDDSDGGGDGDRKNREARYVCDDYDDASEPPPPLIILILVQIPVPLPFFSFTGWRGSFHGDLPMYGKAMVQFYTRTKTVTASWKPVVSATRVPGLDGVGASAPVS